ILVDVPCSGTGTLARHPEIRWRLRLEDLADLQDRQIRLLRNALAYLAPGGRLVYSTCSLEPDENETVVDKVLQSIGSEFRLADGRRVLGRIIRDSIPIDRVISPDGFFRTFPPNTDTDGFFAAIIEKAR